MTTQDRNTEGNVGRNVDRMWGEIDALDFSRMKAKLAHRKDGQWTEATLEQAEAGYRQFLKLAAKYPDAPVVPSELVDHFWHAHILDTQRYAGDCERIFGHMLHHDPYVGIDGAEDEARLHAMAAESNALSLSEFGTALTASPAYCARAEGNDEAAYCARAVGTEPAYCARAVSAEPAYCARAVTTEPAYCARAVSAEPAYCARAVATEPAYCARAVTTEPAYCARAVSAEPAYCARAA